MHRRSKTDRTLSGLPASPGRTHRRAPRTSPVHVLHAVAAGTTTTTCWSHVIAFTMFEPVTSERSVCRRCTCTDERISLARERQPGHLHVEIRLRRTRIVDLRRVDVNAARFQLGLDVGANGLGREASLAQSPAPAARRAPRRPGAAHRVASGGNELLCVRLDHSNHHEQKVPGTCARTPEAVMTDLSANVAGFGD